MPTLTTTGCDSLTQTERLTLCLSPATLYRAVARMGDRQGPTAAGRAGPEGAAATIAALATTTVVVMTMAHPLTTLIACSFQQASIQALLIAGAPLWRILPTTIPEAAWTSRCPTVPG